MVFKKRDQALAASEEAVGRYKELPKRKGSGVALAIPEVLAVLGVCLEELTSSLSPVWLQPRHEPPSLCQ